MLVCSDEDLEAWALGGFQELSVIQFRPAHFIGRR
jgi:hypothetical protein